MISRDNRKQVANETLDILRTGKYFNHAGAEISIAASLKQAIDNTIHIKPGGFAALTLPTARYKTVFEIKNETTLQCASRLITEQKAGSVVCLNFASAKNPGGGFLGGSQAQEESLARSSGLYLSLISKPEMYRDNERFNSCLYTDNMIYSPRVPVIRNDDGALLDQYYELSFITSPAVNVGCLNQHRDKEGLEKADETMVARLKKILSLALHYGHKTIILGTWGCGVFQNEPEKVSAYFYNELMNGGEFENMFEQVNFAVLDPSIEQKIFTAFKRGLGL